MKIGVKKFFSRFFAKMTPEMNSQHIFDTFSTYHTHNVEITLIFQFGPSGATRPKRGLKIKNVKIFFDKFHLVFKTFFVPKNGSSSVKNKKVIFFIKNSPPLDAPERLKTKFSRNFSSQGHSNLQKRKSHKISGYGRMKIFWEKVRKPEGGLNQPPPRS